MNRGRTGHLAMFTQRKAPATTIGHAHERTNGFAAHLALFRRRLEVGVLEQDLRGRLLRRGSALGLGGGLHGHGVGRLRRVGRHLLGVHSDSLISAHYET